MIDKKKQKTKDVSYELPNLTKKKDVSYESTNLPSEKRLLPGPMWRQNNMRVSPNPEVDGVKKKKAPTAVTV